jgi:hypothetical protein
MNVRVVLTKKVTEYFGLGRTHETTISYNVMTDVLHVSTVAKVAAEKGYTITHVGAGEWHGGEDDT